MSCAICEIRRPRRYCPAVRGEICAVCCGESREVTLDCPLECSYLQEARLHERLPEQDLDKIPNMDVEITESFAEANAGLFNFFGTTLFNIAVSSPGVNDNDLREALEAMARTYRTLGSGLIYETRPANLVAADLQQRLSQAVAEVRKQLQESRGMETVRDADVLGIVVMFQRMEYSRNNGRPRSRSFIDFLRREFAPSTQPLQR